MRTALLIAAAVLLTACSNAPNPQSDFVKGLSSLCDQSYIGTVVSDDLVDADWRAAEIEVGPVACGIADIRMPLRVGDNTSRTWIITPGKGRITLKHDHRHDDGSPDAVTLYGGTTSAVGTASRQEFPVDDYSIELFKREGLSPSLTNTWAMEIMPGETLAYELSRPRTEQQLQAGDERGRFFRIEFELGNPPPTKLAGNTPNLRFYLVDSKMTIDQKPTADRKLVLAETTESLWLKTPHIIDETCLDEMRADVHPTGGYPILNFQLDEICTGKLAKMTSENIGQRFAVVLNGQVIAAPHIAGEITNGAGFLSGNFHLDDANKIAKEFNVNIAKHKAQPE